MPSTSNEEMFPTTIQISPVATMTFLRNESYLVRVHMSANSSLGEEDFVVPPHWHEMHDELFHIIQGRLEVTIGSKKRIYTAEDGEILIPRGVVHSIRVFKGEETIVEERTDPMDDGKEIFFRNLFVNGQPKPPNFFYTMRICYLNDMRPAFPGHILWLEKLFVTIFGGWIAPLLGYQLKYTSSEKTD